jgi:hypothetical protein
MGYFSNLEIEIMDMARDLGDPRGENADTVLTVSRLLEVPPLDVQHILHGDPDEDPREYAERSADLDAEYYGA